MNECIHGLDNCATCSGTDDLLAMPAGNGATRFETPWTDAENRVARDASLSTRQVAERIGRPVNNVSAHRLGTLGMAGGWPGYHPHPHRRTARLTPALAR